ncbi:hypothetical protein GWK47_023581 [Chionoecetes opilio]|uniref:Uncharacterized protein n=1 Tax=Chionoecetes opilio TaxID=41210 RepID=A0A8J5CJM6_CHIOP|nr:hypothetical protein GWK47_023581 [Chionoecetes opilio]
MSAFPKHVLISARQRQKQNRTSDQPHIHTSQLSMVFRWSSHIGFSFITAAGKQFPFVVGRSRALIHRNRHQKPARSPEGVHIWCLAHQCRPPNAYLKMYPFHVLDKRFTCRRKSPSVGELSQHFFFPCWRFYVCIGYLTYCRLVNFSP